MINYPLEECFCLDHLSILEVKLKYSKSDNCAQLQKMCNFYANYWAEILGDNKFKEIMTSAEYLELKNCNDNLFQTIENSEHYTVSARTINNLNLLRWKLKNKLQKRFFGKITNEVKIGHTVEK